MSESNLPEEIIQRLKAVTGKRAHIVIEHILEHGFITTEDLETKYGYRHPPRAVRDVREQGIPIESFSVKNSEGRTIAAYRFGDFSTLKRGRSGGRKAFPQAFKDRLIEAYGTKCAICQGEFEPRYLQIDHRVPYEIAGEPSGELDVRDFMLLCGSCNRAKSWSCEHCANWNDDKQSKVCLTCYWANPTDYQHIALRAIRRLDLIWTEEEVRIFERLRLLAEQQELTLPDFVKAALKDQIDDDADD